MRNVSIEFHEESLSVEGMSIGRSLRNLLLHVSCVQTEADIMNRLMPMRSKMVMLRKRYVVGCVNGLSRNKESLCARAAVWCGTS